MQKLELFGKDYIAQFIAMKRAERDEALTYQMYVCESLRLSGENKRLTVKFGDIIEPKKRQPEKTAEQAEAEILAEFKRLGGVQDGEH